MSETTPVKKTRGRKKKIDDNITLTMNVDEPEVIHKKRGRKPKGGKISTKQIIDDNEKANVSNVILHLKCSSQDLIDSHVLAYNPNVPPEIESYEIEKNNYAQYAENNPVVETQYAYDSNNNNNYVCTMCNSEDNDKDVVMKDIYSKLKTLKINLHKNTLQDKKSACFWCTYPFDNPCCYIPKSRTEDEIFGYGSFCRPECAVSYLMKENIDDSTKFERYDLLNNIYGKIFNHKNNIKPAPDPYYTLDKYYGNLSIQEYRRFLKSEHLLLVVEKPMTRVLPELYEENDSFVTKIYGNENLSEQSTGNNVYKVKRQSDKKESVSKNNIINKTFGLSS